MEMSLVARDRERTQDGIDRSRKLLKTEGGREERTVEMGRDKESKKEITEAVRTILCCTMRNSFRKNVPRKTSTHLLLHTNFAGFFWAIILKRRASAQIQGNLFHPR